MDRRIGELRRHHHVARAADGAGQHVVVLLHGGIGHEDVERDHFRVDRRQRVDGARDHLAVPRKAAETGHAGFIDGDDRDIVRNRQRAARAHQPVTGVAAHPGGVPIHQDSTAAETATIAIIQAIFAARVRTVCMKILSLHDPGALDTKYMESINPFHFQHFFLGGNVQVFMWPFCRPDRCILNRRSDAPPGL